MRRERRDPRQARFLTRDSLRWVLRHRAFTPWYLLRYWRFAVFKLRHPHVVTEGFVFLGKGVEIAARRGYGRLVLGRFVHVGDGTAIRCHEGNVRIGDRCVFGRNDTVNAYLDVEFGAAVLVADGAYVCDFDHGMDDIHVPIKDQGIVKSPVRVGPGVWLGNRVTVTRGVAIGPGCAVGAHAVVTRDLPDNSVAVGVPARVVRDRADAYQAAAERRAALARMAEEQLRALARVAG